MIVTCFRSSEVKWVKMFLVTKSAQRDFKMLNLEFPTLFILKGTSSNITGFYNQAFLLQISKGRKRDSFHGMTHIQEKAHLQNTCLPTLMSSLLFCAGVYLSVVLEE